MKRRSIFAAAAILASVSLSLISIAGMGDGLQAAKPAGSGGPVVVELFTSQGCSSCPPADATLERLARDPAIVAITRPVTYWDNLGWRDTLAREDNTVLQRAYAARGGTGSGVYTPQAMVQGRFGVIGSNENDVRISVAKARLQAMPTLTISAGGNGDRTVALANKLDAPAEVVLVALRSVVNVRIGRGENGGRTIRYANVVVGEHVIVNWRDGPLHARIPAQFLHEGGADRAAIIIRTAGAGPIIAAQML
jgi:hypothetical protein